MDNKLVWAHNDKINIWIPETYASSLPSSSLRRNEIQLIKEGKFSESDKFF